MKFHNYFFADLMFYITGLTVASCVAYETIIPTLNLFFPGWNYKYRHFFVFGNIYDEHNGGRIFILENSYISRRMDERRLKQQKGNYRFFGVFFFNRSRVDPATSIQEEKYAVYRFC